MNKKITNKMLTKRKVNKFANGELLEKMNTSSKNAATKAFSGSNLGGSLGVIGNGVAGVIEAGMTNAQIKDTSAEEAAIAETANTTFESGSYDNLQEMWDNSLLGRTDFTQKAVRGLNGWQMAGNTAKGMAKGAIAGAQLGGVWGAIGGAAAGLGSGIAGIFAGNAKARRKAAELNAESTLANKQMLNNYAFAADNTYNQNFNKGVLNFAAYGGDLKMSGDFNNGLIFINEGGTHEENPFEGVQLGVDPEGVPNLVEEGEVVYNDYVFSNRLKPTKTLLEEVGLNAKYADYTIAEIIREIQKESSINPNDWIVENTLKDNINRVMTIQERVRAKKENTSNKFPFGGNKKTAYTRYAENLPKLTIPNITGPRMYADDNYLTELPELSNIVDPNIIGGIKYNSPSPNFNLVDHANKRDQEKYLADMGFEITDEDMATVDNVVPDLSSLKKPKGDFNWQSLGRLAPVITNAGTLISNMRKPDYSQADRIEQAARNIPGGSFTPLGDFINLESVDRNYLLNPMINTSRSTARSLQNQGLNAGQAMAGLLANNYNTQRNIGNALIQADQENVNRAVQEATFNRGTNQANAQMGLQALAMDQQKAQNVLAATQAASQLRQAIDAQRSAAISSSLTNMSEDLSGLGQEATQKDWLKMLTDSGALKAPKTTAKHGGKLLTKKRKK